GNFTFDIPAEGIEIGFARDVADGAAHRARAIQRALRALQHLDAVEIEQPDVGLASAAVIRIRAGDDRLVVVHADGRRPGGGDAADDVLLVARPEVVVRQARDLRRVVGKFLRAGLRELRAGDRLDRG